jgi:dephospho-CoA kinase
MILGLTGSIGSGKSEAALYFKKCGAYIIDADKISRDLSQKGSSALKDISKIFGKDIVDGEGVLNREKLADIVFNDKKKLKKLEKIIHGKILKQIKKEVKTNKDNFKVIIIDAPLLFETGLNKICSKTLAISTQKRIQIKRLKKRNPFWSLAHIEQRINSQMNADKKSSLADFLIDNSYSKNELKKQIENLYKKLL